MLTSKQLARMLGIAESSLRRYVKVFGPFFSDGAKRKRGRVYSQMDVATAGKIREMFSLGFREHEVRAALEKTIDTENPAQQNRMALEYILPEIDKSFNTIRQEQEKQTEWIEETDSWKQDTGSRVSRIETLLYLLFIAVVIFIVVVLIVR